MSEKALNCGDLEINEKKFHTFKKRITLNLVHKDKIVISDKFKQ